MLRLNIIKMPSQMSSQIEFSEITEKVINYLDEFNPKYMTVFFIRNYIIKPWYCIILYLLNNVCMFIMTIIDLCYNGMDVPDKVNCMGFALSTKVKHVRPLLETIARAPKLLSWLKGIKESNVRVIEIEVMDADFFCSTADPTKVDPNRLGFLKIKCTAFDQDDRAVDGIVLIRGPCAVICTVIEDDDENEFILTVEQFRMPMRKRIEEFLAGMCDEHEVENPRTGKTTSRNSPSLNAVLVKELKEEAGLVLDASDPKLHYLGDIMLSPGLLDEKAKMFAWYTKLSNEKIEEMLAKEHGELGTNERIRLHLYPIEEFHTELHRIGDAKTEVAFIRMLNKDVFEPEDDVLDEDYVYETDEDDSESDEEEEEEDDEDEDSLPELIDSDPNVQDQEQEQDQDQEQEQDQDQDQDEEPDDLCDDLSQIDVLLGQLKQHETQLSNSKIRLTRITNAIKSEQDDDACESDHEDMRDEYIKEQKQEREQQLYVFVPEDDADGQEFDESLQLRKFYKPNSTLHKPFVPLCNVIDLTMD